MKIVHLRIPGVALVVPRQIGDKRGYFSEIFREDFFEDACGKWNFVQDNESFSESRGTLRGLHFQSEPHTQGKLVRCTAGALYDVAVDIRRGSPFYGQWISQILTAKNGKQLWLPPGFAHGFCSLEPETVISYKVTSYYTPECERGLAWDDPVVGIDWPDITNTNSLSDRDRAQPNFIDLPEYFPWERTPPCASL
ncbi:dTDP-4-dehydrorhamnose 3,5-epimerase [Novosphingobium sp. PhB57]|uniref:dTDP-4-dehydrorhamnose 3,5-epimerase n=1 Tax=Novosphingobium sp. PhB57 TaxID=2485107 RepID=UPI001043D9F4|nr:dTDP-4-dehydrorhamnose 3,5-epimerase [Novosphingobium sp. PhB57]